MRTAPSRLGALSVLAMSAPAFAGDTAAAAAAPYRLTYETVRTDTGLDVKIYAQNQSEQVLLIDDDPFVEAAWVQLNAGGQEQLNAGFDADMMSRMGPKRRWMAVKPGERLLVGTSHLAPGTVDEAWERQQAKQPAPAIPTSGTLKLSVRVVSKDRTDTISGEVPLAMPAS